MTDRTLGTPPPSTMSLQFKPMSMDAAEVEKTSIPGSPQRPTNSETVGTSGRSASAKPGGDAEMMALLIALDENEVHAAMTAEHKKVNGPVLAFAKILHQGHGRNIQQTQQLGMKIGVTPMESAAVDQLHSKGAQQLAKLVPMTGDEFGRAFVAQMAAGHREALQMIDQWLERVQNDALKQHLTAARQHIATHLKEAEKLQSAKG